MHVQVFVRAFEGWTSDMHQNIKEMGSKCYPFIAPAFKHTSAYPLGRHLCCTVHWVGWHLCCSGDMESKTRGGYWAQVGCGQRWVWAVKKEQWILDGKGWAKNVADIVYPLTKSPVGNSYRLAGKKKNDIGLPEDLGHHQPMINKVTWKKSQSLFGYNLSRLTLENVTIQPKFAELCQPPKTCWTDNIVWHWTFHSSTQVDYWWMIN